MVAPQAYLALSALIFTLGVLVVLLRRGAIVILMGIEMMLNAGNLAFVTFARHHGAPDGLVIVFFTVAIAASEAAVGLGIVIALFRLRETTDVNQVNLLKW